MEFELLDLEVEGMDQVIAYNSTLHYPSVILRKGGMIIHARFYTHVSSSVAYELEEWADKLAECLR